MTDYKPGQIAKATVHGVPDVTVMFAEDGTWRSDKGFGQKGHMHFQRDVTDIRPLVVLDLGVEPHRFVDVLRESMRRAPDQDAERLLSHLSHVIEKQLPPAIEEPRGLGAVVEDDKGVRYVRGHESSNQWEGPDDFRNWDEVYAVRILSEGVES